MHTFSQRRWFATVAAACFCCSTPRVTPAAIPVYGSPGYTPGVGGYIVSVGQVDGLSRSMAVSNSGVAVGEASRFDAAGASTDSRALRWSSSASEVLGHLGTSGGLAFAAANAINDSNTAVGAATMGFGNQLPARWDSSGAAATQLTTPMEMVGATPVDINASGVMVGIGDLPAGMGTRAIRWNAAGTPSVLPTLPGFNATAKDVNDSGVVVGRAFSSAVDDDRAVRWDAAGAITELGNLGLSAQGTTLVSVAALNSAGVAVGHAAKYDSVGSYLGTLPVRWEGTAAIELNTLSLGPGGFLAGSARDINDAGVVIGDVWKAPAFPTDEFGLRAARWDAEGTALTVLGTLGVAANGEASARAFAINASGLIVGTSSAHNSATELENPRAVLWGPSGVAVDLNTLIDPASGWTLTHAYAVSDTAWIAGDGYYDPDGPGGQEAYGRHFVMHVPEPSAAALCVAAAISCLRMRRVKAHCAISPVSGA